LPDIFVLTELRKIQRPPFEKENHVHALLVQKLVADKELELVAAKNAVAGLIRYIQKNDCDLC
jgi:hypothetical protein